MGKVGAGGKVEEGRGREKSEWDSKGQALVVETVEGRGKTRRVPT